ncbi:unnamed protein product [Protopolystoma xenopodis]|uniref:Uncharacterized protein n=1 Tax=Protopolystoma xenopodis TaxID=117903 RepID=A0A3S5FCH2_9PLAT|nr:unnamed protein product [Protopolystoma xenopodis]
MASPLTRDDVARFGCDQQVLSTHAAQTTDDGHHVDEETQLVPGAESPPELQLFSQVLAMRLGDLKETDRSRGRTGGEQDPPACGTPSRRRTFTLFSRQFGLLKRIFENES